MIDWKRKLTSRKFWAAVAGFVSMLLIYLGKDGEEIAALIMAGASLIAYIVGEGLADTVEHKQDPVEWTYTVGDLFDEDEEDEDEQAD